MPEANLDGQGRQKTLFCIFFGSNLWVQIFLKMKEHKRKCALKQEIETSCTVWIGVSSKFHLHFTLMFQLRYYKMLQSLGIQKLVSKIIGISTTSDKQSKKCQLKHDIQWIYLTLLSNTCLQIHQITYVIFETINYFSQHNSSVSFQLKNYILSTKVAHQSENFQTFHCSG